MATPRRARVPPGPGVSEPPGAPRARQRRLRTVPGGARRCARGRSLWKPGARAPAREGLTARGGGERGAPSDSCGAVCGPRRVGAAPPGGSGGCRQGWRRPREARLGCASAVCGPGRARGAGERWRGATFSGNWALLPCSEGVAPQPREPRAKPDPFPAHDRGRSELFRFRWHPTSSGPRLRSGHLVYACREGSESPEEDHSECQKLDSLLRLRG
ncbi:unnamed protein product [Rangifer tarandus platyrhynchus]|uniref:Uncharacterized protein n=1 Tax=Rangifer tarandus platyrhynchus TaxID=3082113 RepID=A0ABN8YW79_RANTA|nr:unnamed protein product [Rangifer tarandus platyrhynchus]